MEHICKVALVFNCVRCGAKGLMGEHCDKDQRRQLEFLQSCARFGPDTAVGPRRVLPHDLRRLPAPPVPALPPFVLSILGV
eukprot:2234856-Amphidinium_carterae.1